MLHDLPENFNISDFDVFHSALISRGSSYIFVSARKPVETESVFIRAFS